MYPAAGREASEGQAILDQRSDGSECPAVEWAGESLQWGRFLPSRYSLSSPGRSRRISWRNHRLAVRHTRPFGPAIGIGRSLRCDTLFSSGSTRSSICTSHDSCHGQEFGSLHACVFRTAVWYKKTMPLCVMQWGMHLPDDGRRNSDVKRGLHCV